MCDAAPGATSSGVAGKGSTTRLGLLMNFCVAIFDLAGVEGAMKAARYESSSSRRTVGSSSPVSGCVREV